jgi:signal transduction histidine kinase
MSHRDARSTPRRPSVSPDSERRSSPVAGGRACGGLTPEFLASLAAELNAGLHGVLALTELLERQPLGGDAPAYVRTLADCGRTLINVLADALEVSATQLQAESAPEPVRLRDLLDEVQAEWMPRAVGTASPSGRRSRAMPLCQPSSTLKA